MIYKMRYILWVAALLGASDVITKRREFKLFDARHVEYDIIKHFAAFCQRCMAFHLKKSKNPHFCQNDLTTCLL